MPDVFWFDEHGEELQGNQWEKGCGRYLGMQRARKLDDDHVELVILLANAGEESFEYCLPVTAMEYGVHLDTAHVLNANDTVENGLVTLQGRSAVLLSGRIHIDKLWSYMEERLASQAEEAANKARAEEDVGAEPEAGDELEDKPEEDQPEVTDEPDGADQPDESEEVEHDEDSAHADEDKT